MDTENGAIPFATASHPGYPFTFKRRESLPGAPERYTCIYKDGGIRTFRARIGGWRPKRACRAGLVLAADVDVSGRRVVDVAPDSRVRGSEGAPEANQRSEDRPMNRNMARSSNRRVAGGLLCHDFKPGQSFGEPQGRNNSRLTTTRTPTKSPGILGLLRFARLSIDSRHKEVKSQASQDGESGENRGRGNCSCVTCKESFQGGAQKPDLNN